MHAKLGRFGTLNWLNRLICNVFDDGHRAGLSDSQDSPYGMGLGGWVVYRFDEMDSISAGYREAREALEMIGSASK